MKKTHPSRGIVLYLFLCFFILPSALVRADMRTSRLSPTRVIMADRTRSAIVKLINPDKVDNTYKIRMVLTEMDETGELRDIKNPTPQQEEILKMFRFSPRKAVVAPGKYQNIRIMVRKPAVVSPREYRAHLQVTPVSPLSSPAPKKEKEHGQTSIKVNVRLATSIPIILRSGQGSVTLTPTFCSLDRNAKNLRVQLERTGEYSAYFGIVAYRMGADGTKEKIAERLGLGFYPPLTEKTLQLPLENPELVHSLAGQRIFLEIRNYENRSEPAKGPWEFTLQ